MENGNTVAHSSAHKIMGNHQLVIITRLLQHIETMQSVDELFAWLSDMLIQRMDVQVVQFWAMQAYTNRRVSYDLRTTVCQSVALPQHIVINQPLSGNIEQLFNTQQSIAPQAVEHTFSPYHSGLLKRYGINYWACYFMSSNLLLPPANNNYSHERVMTPLKIAVTIFLQNRPSPRLLPTLSHILDHVLPIAKKHGLLTSHKSQATTKVKLNQSQQTGQYPALTTFVPYRIQTVNPNRAAGTGEQVLQDKNVQHLYHEIDGHKTIGDLMNTTQLGTQEFYTALCLLLAQKCIQLFEMGKSQENSV